SGVAADEVGFRKPVLEISHELVRIVTELDGANAAVASGYENGAQRTLADGESDFGFSATVAKRRRSHAQHLFGGFVEPAPGIEAGIVYRRGHAAISLGQFLAQAPRPMRKPIGFRRQPRHRLEQAVK